MSQPKNSIAKKQAELADILQWFESENFVIDQAADQLAKARKLAAEIDNDLSQLENEITVLAERFDGDDA